MNIGDRVSFQMPPSDSGEIYPVRCGQIHRGLEDEWVEVLVGHKIYLVKREWFLKTKESVNA